MELIYNRPIYLLLARLKPEITEFEWSKIMFSLEGVDKEHY